MCSKPGCYWRCTIFISVLWLIKVTQSKLTAQHAKKQALTMKTAQTSSSAFRNVKTRMSNKDIRIHSSALAIAPIVRMSHCQHIVLFNILLAWPWMLFCAAATLCQGL